MSLAQAESYLINRLDDNLPNNYTTKQIKYPNAPFNTPNDKPWLRMTTIPEPTSNVEVGGGYQRTYGLFVVDCFYPVDTGSKKQHQDVAYFQALFNNQEFGIVKCQEAYIQTIGSDGDWYNLQLNVTFYYEG